MNKSETRQHDRVLTVEFSEFKTRRGIVVLTVQMKEFRTREEDIVSSRRKYGLECGTTHYDYF